MESLIAAAGRALARGDTLGALQRVGHRDDPPALALRGIAMAQFGEHARARELLRRAARGFGTHDALARARCVVADAEVALAMRELGAMPHGLAGATATLDALGDPTNAAQARLVALRHALLVGRLAQAAAALESLDLARLPPLQRAVGALASAELALRSLRTADAHKAFAMAQDAAARTGAGALAAEVDEARAVLERPVARRLLPAGTQPALRLHEVEALLASGALVLDACRHGVRAGAHGLALARRPLLFALARALAEAWPGDVGRESLIERVFRTRRPDETHRARLRVEIGRLRALFAPLARIEATARGFMLRPPPGREVIVIVPPIDGEHAALLALLADGAAWSTSALALATGASQRTVQRALAELLAAGQVRSIGRARAQRWLAPPLVNAAEFATILLLPAALPLG